MRMKRILLTMVLVASAAVTHADVWKNLDADHKLGPTAVKPEDLAGKVVVLYNWNTSVEQSVAQLPRLEQIWKSFSRKLFMMLGSADGDSAAAKLLAAKFSFPNYFQAGREQNGQLMLGRPGLLVVIDAFGREQYAGHDERAATEALVNAIGEAEGPTQLCQLGSLKKLKSKKSALKLGKNFETTKKDLEKIASGRDKTAAAEAKLILMQAEKTREDFVSIIGATKKTAPVRAYNFLKTYRATWPKSAAEFDELWKTLSSDPEIVKAAKKQK